MKKLSLKRWHVLVAVSIGVIVNIYILLKDFDGTTIDSLTAIDKELVMSLLLILILSWLIEGFRLKWISDQLGLFLSLKDAIKLHLVTVFGAFSTPLGSGEIPMFMYWGVKKGKEMQKWSAFAILRLLFTKMVFLILILLNYFLYRGSRDWGTLEQSAFITVSLVILVTSLIYVGVIFNFKTFSKVLKFLPEELIDENVVLGKEIKRILFNKPLVPFILTLLYWATFFFPAVLLSHRLGLDLDLLQVFFKQVTVYLTIPLSPLPGGAGVVEILYYSIFSGILGSGQIAVFILLIRIINFYLPLLLGAIIAIKDSKLI